MFEPAALSTAAVLMVVEKGSNMPAAVWLLDDVSQLLFNSTLVNPHSHVGSWNNPQVLVLRCKAAIGVHELMSQPTKSYRRLKPHVRKFKPSIVQMH